MLNHIKDYFSAVCEAKRLGSGNIETTFNAPIITLLEAFGCTAKDLSGERSGKVGENIDIKLWHSDVDVTEYEPFAGVEVKKIGGIDKRAMSQIKSETIRYGNAILTDNLEWQFWHSDSENEPKMYAVSRPIAVIDGVLVLQENEIENFINFVNDFLLRDPANIRSANKLAEYMAAKARSIKSVITSILKDDGTGQPLVDDRQRGLAMFSELFGLFSKIKSDLRPRLDTHSFADMYAQTIVYGLFIARYNDDAPKSFNRYEAIGRLKDESPLLNQFFMHIASTRGLHASLELTIDELCDLYRICDVSGLLDSEHNKLSKRSECLGTQNLQISPTEVGDLNPTTVGENKDTIVHFYENFLSYYDPELRKALGVFYTPQAVVRYLISMVDKLLVDEFGISDGLMDNSTVQIKVPCKPYTKQKGGKEHTTKEITVPKVAVLDPACGTGTFHAEMIKYIKEHYFKGAKSAFYGDYMRKEKGLLSRLIGFEIMMTSYVVAHLNIRRAIEETLGHIPEKQMPTRIYLTNTLAPPHSTLEQDEQISLFDFSAAITDEAYRADTWKSRRPIKVIIGNPPYLAASTNPFDISAYKFETDGETKLKERTSKWLNDDYVKFFRFAEQIIDKNGEGILAFVSNNGYLDSSTFRGMRASLLRTFDKIFIVNLHGSAKKSEVTPEGKKDENVFDIMQGISLFVGIKTTQNKEWANVKYVDLWGLRQQKFDVLNSKHLDYIELKLHPQMAYFIPIGNGDREVYEKGINVNDLFPANVTGIVSGRDNAAIAPTREELEKRINIVTEALNEKTILELWGKFTKGQTAETIRDDIILNEGVVTPISYRPFDKRWIYYSGSSCGWVVRPREKTIMGHLINGLSSPIGKNIGLVYPRGTNSFWDGAFVSESIIDAHFIDYPTRSIAYIAPLYTYNELAGEYVPNLNSRLLSQLVQNLTFEPSPIEVFDYIYGVLYDPTYRERFNEFLKRDYPRVPIAENDEVFLKYVTAGEQLRKLHLLQTKVPAELAVEPADSDNMEIEAIKYKNRTPLAEAKLRTVERTLKSADYKDGVLHINKGKRIIGIPEDVWAYRIGGYQVLDKWFKSRKGEKLTFDGITHIENVVGVIKETIKVQERLSEEQ